MVPSNLVSPIEPIYECVACGNANLKRILDLGNHPLANEYLSAAIIRQNYPLTVNLCNNCTHIQLGAQVNPKLLFEDYSYLSSTSRTLSDYFCALKDKIIDEFGPGGKILDIGSNDGSFLSKFKDSNWNGLGVDPAANLAAAAMNSGVKTISAYYNLNTAEVLCDKFDVVVAMNVFAHTVNPQELLNAISLNIKASGYAYIQTSQADMAINAEFDTVYHEHISFFNMKSMKALLARSGWYLHDVSIVDIHGKSYLWKISRKNTPRELQFQREMYEKEKKLYSISYYDSFASRCITRATEMFALVDEYKRRNFLIATFGSAAKGNTFLNFAKITPDYIFDETPTKIGKLSPVGDIIVRSAEEIPIIGGNILFVIPAWNFAEEIKRKIISLRNVMSETHIVTYFPEISLETL